MGAETNLKPERNQLETQLGRQIPARSPERVREWLPRGLYKQPLHKRVWGREPPDEIGGAVTKPCTQSCAAKAPCQKDPEVVFWPSVFLKAWGTKAKQPDIFRKILVFWPCRLRRQGRKTILFLKMCGFMALVPRASKKPPGQQKHFGIPLTMLRSNASG